MKPKSPLTKKLVSALKHKPWAAAHKERPAHSGTAEAHNAEPAAPTKKYVSDAQRKAVHASKADGGKGAPTKKTVRDYGTGKKRTERKMARLDKKREKNYEKEYEAKQSGDTKKAAKYQKRGDKANDRALKVQNKSRKKQGKEERSFISATESPAKLIKRKKPKVDPSKIRVPGPGYNEMRKREREKEQAERKKQAEKRKNRAKIIKDKKAEKKTQ